MTTRIMYIEVKGGGLAGPARIGRVTFSQTGRTLYYAGRAFRSLLGRGYKENYFNAQTGVTYWISGPRKDGCDALYPAVVEVDSDVREEHWRDIRGQLDSVRVAQFRSPGKHTRRRPHPDLNTHGTSRNGGSRRAAR